MLTTPPNLNSATHSDTFCPSKVMSLIAITVAVVSVLFTLHVPLTAIEVSCVESYSNSNTSPPAIPLKPDQPLLPEKPDVPLKPLVPLAPEKPLIPEAAEKPLMPENPDTPEKPDVPT